MRALIRQSKNRIKQLRVAARAALPRQFHIARPIGQLFLGGDFRTTYTLINFPSFFAPAVAASYRYRLRVHDEGGVCCAERTVDLGPFASRAITLSGPELGLVTVEIEPRNSFLYADRHMGDLRPHFFAKYEDVKGTSVGIIHPQTAIGAPPASSLLWASNALLETPGVRAIELYQINPSHQPAPSRLKLLRATTGEILAESAATLPPLGSRRVSWDLPLDEQLVRIEASGLPGINAKPLAFLRFADGSFSAFHT